MKIEMDDHELNQVLNRVYELGRTRQELEDVRQSRYEERVKNNDLSFEIVELKQQLAAEQQFAVPKLSKDDANEILKMWAPVFEFMSKKDERGYYTHKIPAIKKVRELTGCGLKDAKDLVEGNYNRDT